MTERMKHQHHKKTVANSWQGWAEIGGKRHYFKSLWEYNYACYLQWLKSLDQIKEWEYEPKTFWFEGIRRGVTNYKPDFRVTENNDSTHWDEVKGYMDQKSKTKIKRFKKYFPEETIRVVGAEWFKKFKWKTLVPGWKYDTRNK